MVDDPKSKWSDIDRKCYENDQKVGELYKELLTSSASLQQKIETFSKDANEYNQILRARSKRPDELVVSVTGLVRSVVNTVKPLSYSFEEFRFGTNPKQHVTGYEFRSKIEIGETNTPVTKLTFYGWPNLQSGDTVKAYILKGEELEEKAATLAEQVTDDLEQAGAIRLRRSHHWIDREFREVEEPFKLEKLVNDQVVVSYELEK